MRVPARNTAAERRLLHFADGDTPEVQPGSAPKSVQEQYESLLQEQGGNVEAAVNALVAAEIADADDDAEALRLITLEIQKRYDTLRQQKGTRVALEELKSALPSLEMRSKPDDENKIEVQFKATSSTPPEATTAFGRGVESVGRQLVDIAKKLLPILMEIRQKIMDFVKMFKDMQEDFLFDNNTLAQNDRQIGNQISNPETAVELLYQHRTNTQNKLDELDRMQDPTYLQEKRDRVETLKKQKAEKISEKSDDAPAQEKIAREYDELITKAESEIAAIEQRMSTAELDRKKYEDRLAAIEAALARRRPAGEPAQSKEQYESGQEEGEEAPRQTAEEALESVKTLLSYNTLTYQEVTTGIVELNSILKNMTEAERTAFYEAQKIYNAQETDVTHKQFNDVNGDTVQVTYNSDGLVFEVVQ